MAETFQLAIFASTDPFIRAGGEVCARGYRIESIYSPFRVAEIEELVYSKASAVRILTLAGGIFGGIGLVALAVWAHLSFSLLTSGKPVLPWVPWVVVCFEGIILMGSLFSFFSWILMGRLPRISLPDGYDPRFSKDRFGLLIVADEMTREDVRSLLFNAGAEEVRDVS